MSRVPVATYRVQLHGEFGFDDAARIADYLEQLGISHMYCSPYLQAAPGSKHGYDIVDHHSVNEELGGSKAHERFCLRLGACHLGQVLDIVPNHMAISGRRNRYWWDVLENGPSSPYASFFDIDWETRDVRLQNKLLVPILGDHYGRVLNRHEIKIKRRGGEFYLEYFDHHLPVAPRAMPWILGPAAERSGSDYLAFLSDCFARLPAASDTDRSSIAERHRDKEVLRNLLERLFSEVPFIGEAVDATLERLNQDVNALDDFLEHQNYRIAFWRTARQELPYRRFFDVNTLVGLCVEDPHVFADTHALILNWLHHGVLDGIRIDHPDGLRDPARYFRRLRQEARDVWIVAEKILEPGEPFRTDWPIDGLTGYDFLNQAAGLMIDSEAEQEFTSLYTDFTGERADYAAVCRDKKHRVLRELLGSDVNRLTSLFLEVCEIHRNHRDYTREDIIQGLRELVACFPVYRTYIVPARNEITEEDIRFVEQAVGQAKANRPDIDPELLDFFCDVLVLRVRGPLETEFLMRFQQFTGPAMAKGIEDTVFYSYNRLIALNEVGGDPGRFGTGAKEFHEFCSTLQNERPRTMLGSSTHDTKRSEDVRARIAVLSEIPQVWRQAVERWSAMNEKHKSGGMPDRNTEYFLYQTLVGAWPIGTSRLLPYMEKACREAKLHTSWHAPDESFEAATRDFISALYKDPEFVADFKAFLEPLIAPARVNSLAQLLLKLTAPGVPDVYQGTELWDFSLVDPDNRRPVDYELRRKLLSEIPRLNVEEVWNRADEGLPKLWTIHHTLRVRRNYPHAFDERGTYTPLYASGPKACHVVSYKRGEDIVVLVPRLPLKLNGNWEGTSIELPVGRWRNRLTSCVLEGGPHSVSELLRLFPIALFARESDASL
jgi:(1->4)-alpha-D-glucan 1-alpha-D-glucosylmutase